MKKKNVLLLSATTLLGVIGVSGLATKADAATVTVKPNDTVWDFSQAYHVSVDQIKTANHLQGENPIILIGQKLEIPTSAAQQAASTAQPDWNQQLAAQSAATASAQAASAAAQSAAAQSAAVASQAAQSAATQSANEAAAQSAAAASAQAASAAAQQAATKAANEAAAKSAAAQSAAASQQAASQTAVVASAQAASAAAQSAAIASNQAASQAAATKAANEAAAKAATQQANQQAASTQQQQSTAKSSSQTATGNYTFTYYNATPSQGWGDASTTADGTSTATGRDADGYLIAAAGSNIAFGTHIQTPYGEAVVHDRGGAVSGNHIDVLQ